MTMTLEQVRNILRTAIIRGHDAIAMADAIDAHLTQPAQSVDVEKVREVIANIRDDQRLGIATADEVDIADKLTAALQEKGNG